MNDKEHKKILLNNKNSPVDEESIKRAQELSLNFYTEHKIEKLREKSKKLP
jgi:hypothetical protein